MGFRRLGVLKRITSMAEFPASETTRTRLKPMVSPIVNAEKFIPLLHTEMVDAVSVLLFIFTLLVSATLFCKAFSAFAQ